MYALNNFGELTSTQVNTIDGYVLTDRTINADKIIAHSITANEITVENLIGANGWINLAQGTFNYGNALIWDGNQLTVSGVVTASGGAIGGFSLGDRYIESTATISGTTYRGWLEKNSGLSTNYFWGVQVNGASKAYVRYDGYFYANNANITGDITATSLTARDTIYIYDDNGNKMDVLSSYKVTAGSKKDLFIGTGAAHIHIPTITYIGTDGSIECGDIECSTINGGSYYNIELGSASTGGAAFTLPSDGTYLLITGHNSTAALNGIHIVRTSGNTAFKVAGAANITVTVSGTRLLVKTNGGTVNVYAVKLG